jgi:hypothetical protein
MFELLRIECIPAEGHHREVPEQICAYAHVLELGIEGVEALFLLRVEYTWLVSTVCVLVSESAYLLIQQ